MKLTYVVLLTTLVFGAASSAGVVDYTLVGLGTFPGGWQSFGLGINDAGWVTGDSTAGDGADHAFLYDGSTMHDMGVGIGNAINDAGWVTGGNGAEPEHAFLYDGSTVQDLGTLGGLSLGLGINDAGWVTGYSTAQFGVNHAFLFKDSAMRDLGALDGDTASYGMGINNAGWVTGYSINNQWQQRAFLYDGSTMRDLGGGIGYAINNAGWVTGVNGDGHAFLYKGSMMQDLGVLPDCSYTVGMAINDAGWIVGYGVTDDTGDSHACLYDGCSLVDLSTFFSGWTLYAATGLNNNGQITGYGEFGGVTQAFLLTLSPRSHGNPVWPWQKPNSHAAYYVTTSSIPDWTFVNNGKFIRISRKH